MATHPAQRWHPVAPEAPKTPHVVLHRRASCLQGTTRTGVWQRSRATPGVQITVAVDVITGGGTLSITISEQKPDGTAGTLITGAAIAATGVVEFAFDPRYAAIANKTLRRQP